MKHSKVIPVERTSRVVRCNQPESNLQFVDNVVITSRYTALNFVPKFLLEQFSRFANFYFLVVSVLQCVPAISITGGVPTSLFPLASVLLFDAIVTANEDYSRHKADTRDNSKPCGAVREGRLQQVPWSDIRVGDIVRIRRGQIFPADIVFLSAVADDGALSDVCYVQTAQLDGETNLKLRSALAATVSTFVSDEAAAGFDGFVECEAPNEFFDKFTGLIQMGQGPSAQREPLEADNILLRGCVLRNVQFVYGLVVYTGTETKVRVKQQVRAGKTASIEGVINTNILLLMAVLASVCLLGAVGWATWTTTATDVHGYLQLQGVSFLGIVEKLFTFFLLNSAFIPVSLYVSMKMARTAQKFMMQADPGMYYEDAELLKATDGAEGSFPMQVRSMDLNDELGRVSYVFSDKTGTFTLNYMQFRKLVVNGISYGLGTTQIGRDRIKRLGLQGSRGKLVGADAAAAAQEEQEEEEEEPAIMRTATQGAKDKNGRQMVPHVSFQDGSESHPGRTFFEDVASETNEGQRGAIRQFLLHLVLNHTVIPEVVRDEEGNPVGRQLSASSPDEEAFVYASEYFGLKFVDRRGATITLEIEGRLEDYTVLYILGYNQMRKRMSVLVEDPAGKLWLYMKGADSVVYERLRTSEGDNESQVKLDTERHLCNWGNDGLRTLVFAYKEVDRNDYEEWSVLYEAARSNMDEMTKRKHKQPNQIDALMEQMESDCILQGATANEDRLQPQVPETIQLFAKAGIKIWMLTGDKQETAINIGFATKLITDEMEQLVFTSAEMPVEEVVTSLQARARQLREEGEHAERQAWALVIDEKALDHVLAKASQDLLEVSRACKAVICCRARPDQKAKMVALIKEGVPGTYTLAVGDGANDVDMIKEAHVGVGIAGAEGVQAANASDYSIGRFKFLQRLVLVHGRWNYRRMSKLVVYMFYKNISFVLTQFWFSMMTGFSGQKFYIELMSQSFNLTFTGLPILVLGVLDRDVSDKLCLQFPMVYGDGPKGRRLNKHVFWLWIFSAIAESLIIFLGCCEAYTSPHEGATPYIFELGLVCFACVVATTNIRVAMEMNWQHWGFQASIAASALSLLPMVGLFGLWDADGMRGGVGNVFSSPLFWLVVPVICMACSLRVMIIKTFKRYFCTELRHVVTEAQVHTKRYSVLGRWQQQAYAAELAGQTYTPTPGALAAPVRTGSGRQTGASMAWAEETKDGPSSSPVKRLPPTNPTVVTSSSRTQSHPAMTASRATRLEQSKPGHSESARHMWHKLKVANKVSFRHHYAGCTYSEDHKTTEKLAGILSKGRLRSHATAPPSYWQGRTGSTRELGGSQMSL